MRCGCSRRATLPRSAGSDLPGIHEIDCAAGRPSPHDPGVAIRAHIGPPEGLISISRRERTSLVLAPESPARERVCAALVPPIKVDRCHILSQAYSRDWNGLQSSLAGARRFVLCPSTDAGSATTAIRWARSSAAPAVGHCTSCRARAVEPLPTSRRPSVTSAVGSCRGASRARSSPPRLPLALQKEPPPLGPPVRFTRPYLACPRC